MTTYPEEDLLPISALQHLAFCERQCALIHLEHLWGENRLTAEGRLLHEKAHEGPDEARNDVRTERGVALRSSSLGLFGIADVIEYRQSMSGTWQPYPVEYKRGRPKANRCDELQLCAQALCLEEMNKVAIPTGALFYGQPRRRKEITFDEVLRTLTRDCARRLHTLFERGRTPPARFEKKCESCSLMHLCLPKVTGVGKDVQSYLRRMLAE
ncbi:MAG: CRISPR-associated protein Cas4 [Deltaproteobacteria bacterium RIFOXYA12_FULL_61_11]|nr:MAG: CRISPR-associated protein Cas4 [Deltaproteobacteria bacterium RIFOXYA12_FULL_61_11]